MTENFTTTKSMLADHRFKPYHFKGLRQDQIDGIMSERAQQVKEAEMKREMAQEEERLWALQAEHNRRLQVIADMKMKRAGRTVDMACREMQSQQATQAREFWKDPYGEKQPTFQSK